MSVSSGDEDRSKWRYEEGGDAFEAAVNFVGLLKVLTRERLNGEDVSSRINELRALVTQESWPRWRDKALAGFNIPLLNELGGCLQKVRFPADGMAYVFYPITHPDQDEPFTIDEMRQMYINFVTLLLIDGEWRVHEIGPTMIPPQDLGLSPYSW